MFTRRAVGHWVGSIAATVAVVLSGCGQKSAKPEATAPSEKSKASPAESVAAASAGTTHDLDQAAALDVPAPLPFEEDAGVSNEMAAIFLQWGIELAAAGDLDNAIAHFEKAVELSPESLECRRQAARAYAARGDASKKRGKLTDAIDDYENAAELDPSGVGGERIDLVEMNLAAGKKIYVDWMASPNKKPAELDRAVDHLTRVLQIKENPDAYQLRSYCCFAMGKLENSVKDATKFLTLRPGERQSSDVYRLRGSMYLAEYLQRQIQKSLDKAIADLESAVRLDPKQAANQRVLANALAAAKNGNRSLIHATRACELSEFKDWESLFALGSAHYLMGRHDEAVRWAAAACDLAPEKEKPALRVARQAFAAKPATSASTTQPSANATQTSASKAQPSAGKATPPVSNVSRTATKAPASASKAIPKPADDELDDFAPPPPVKFPPSQTAN